MQNKKNTWLLKNLLKEVLEFYVYWNLNADEKELKIYEDFFMEDEDILSKVIEEDESIVYLLIHAINIYRVLILLLPYAKTIKDTINYEHTKVQVLSQRVKGKLDINYLINQINKGTPLNNIEKLKFKVSKKHYRNPENIFVVYILKTLAYDLSIFLEKLDKEALKLDINIANLKLFERMVNCFNKTTDLISTDVFGEILIYIAQFQNKKLIFEELEKYMINNVGKLWHPYRKFFELYRKHRELKEDYDFIFEDQNNFENRLFELFVLKNIILFLGPSEFIRKNFRSEFPIYLKNSETYSIELYFQSSKGFNSEGIYVKKNNIKNVVKMIPDIVVKIHDNKKRQNYFVIIDAKYKGDYQPEDVYQGIAYLEHFQIRYNPFILIYCKEKSESLRETEIIENKNNPSEKLIRTMISIEDQKYNKHILIKILQVINNPYRNICRAFTHL